MDREIAFEMKEIKHKRNRNMPNGMEAYVHTISGYAKIKGEEITILVDDNEQPHKGFIATDYFLTKFIRKLFNYTK